MGILLTQVERYDEAIASFNRALEIDPDNTVFQNNLREAGRLLALVTTPATLDNRDFVPGDRISQLQRSIVRTITRSPEGIREGTGWVIARNGDTVLILSNRHVLTHNGKANDPNLSEEIEIDWFSEVPNRVYRRQPARLLHHSQDPDLALIEVRDAPEDVQPLDLSFELPAILSEIIAIGHPSNGDPWSVVRGEIANRNTDRLQIDATIAGGNSGGPVLDSNDRIVGMILAVEIDDNTNSGFAVAYPLARLRSQLEAWGAL